MDRLKNSKVNYYFQKIQLISQLMNCQHQTFRRILNITKAREFVFKKPYLGSINFESQSLLLKHQNFDSIHKICIKNKIRVAKLIRLRMKDIISELR